MTSIGAVPAIIPRSCRRPRLDNRHCDSGCGRWPERVPIGRNQHVVRGDAFGAGPEPHLYGFLDVSVGRTQAPGGKANDAIDSGRMTTSFVVVKGGENLGGGMTAVFALASFMRADTSSSGRFHADTLWARNAYVGLASNRMGSVQLGSDSTSLFVQTLS